MPLEWLAQGEQTWVYVGVPGANIQVQPSRTQLRELLGCRQATNIALNFYPPFVLFGGALPTGFPNYNGLMEILTFDSDMSSSSLSPSNYNTLTKSHHFGWMPLLQIQLAQPVFVSTVISFYFPNSFYLFNLVVIALGDNSVFWDMSYSSSAQWGVQCLSCC